MHKQRGEDGHLATSPVSGVHRLAWCVITHCLLFYQRCVSVYRPGNVIGGTLYMWKAAEDRGAGDKGPPCSSSRLLLSIGVIKAQYQLPKTTPCVHAHQTHLSNKQYSSIQLRQMFTGCVLTSIDRLEPDKNPHAGFMMYQLGS